LLVHNFKFAIGHVDRFYEKAVEIHGETIPILAVEFTINDEAFIDAIRDACLFRFAEVAPAHFTSSDGFLPVAAAGPDDDDDDGRPDITAHQALLQRLPGLSLAHDVHTLDVLELSLCVAGARANTVLTEAVYCPDVAGRPATNESRQLFARFLTGLHAISNVHGCRKVENDIRAVGLPQSCLVYSLGRTAAMDSVPQHVGAGNDPTDNFRKAFEEVLAKHFGSYNYRPAVVAAESRPPPPHQPHQPQQQQPPQCQGHGSSGGGGGGGHCCCRHVLNYDDRSRKRVSKRRHRYHDDDDNDDDNTDSSEDSVEPRKKKRKDDPLRRLHELLEKILIQPITRNDVEKIIAEKVNNNTTATTSTDTDQKYSYAAAAPAPPTSPTKALKDAITDPDFIFQTPS
jgi:hypothetical protein